MMDLISSVTNKPSKASAFLLVVWIKAAWLSAVGVAQP